MKQQDLSRVYIYGRFTILQLMSTITVAVIVTTVILNYCC